MLLLSLLFRVDVVLFVNATGRALPGAGNLPAVPHGAWHTQDTRWPSLEPQKPFCVPEADAVEVDTRCPSCFMACSSLGNFAVALIPPCRKQSIALSTAQNRLLIKLSSRQDCKGISLMLQRSRKPQGLSVIIHLLNNTDTQWLNYSILL